jgi:hypothetical protein
MFVTSTPDLSHRHVMPRSELSSVTPQLVSGCSTPLPASHLASPAWAPTHILDTNTSEPGPSQNAMLPQPKPNTQHVLLDERLIGCQMKVVCHGKEIVAVVNSTDGNLTLRKPIYRSSEWLDPRWIMPKHPNPTRDNGLLVVIRGDHCGKFVRRIHHRYQGKQAIMILAVLNRSTDNFVANSLTGEQLDLDPTFLCASSESTGERKWNDRLVSDQRIEARKIRAK